MHNVKGIKDKDGKITKVDSKTIIIDSSGYKPTKTNGNYEIINPYNAVGSYMNNFGYPLVHEMTHSVQWTPDNRKILELTDKDSEKEVTYLESEYKWAVRKEFRWLEKEVEVELQYYDKDKKEWLSAYPDKAITKYASEGKWEEHMAEYAMYYVMNPEAFKEENPDTYEFVMLSLFDGWEFKNPCP